MPTARPFARNTGAAIAGTTQIGNLAIGTPTAGFAATGLPWWNGPDEELGYVIATQVPSNNQPTPVPPSVTASVGFWRSTAKTDASFIDLAQYVSRIAGSPQTFASASVANAWLTTNGYWTSWVAPLQIGDSYGGGIVAYIYQPGDPGYDANVQHGLIAGTTNASDDIKWWNGVYPNGLDTGATGIILGTGMSNTNAIIAAQGVDTYAAYVCKNYTGGGYTDWFLPSVDELSKLYINRAYLNMTTSFYWSSTDCLAYGFGSPSEYARQISWFSGFANCVRKNNYPQPYGIMCRAVRYF